MGREVRMVPPDWDHPTNRNGIPIPLYKRNALDYEDVVIEECDVMPDFGDRATHFRMYEDTSEGTPISPAFETKEELAQWLTDNEASAFGDMTGDYDYWLNLIEQGSGGLLVMNNGKMWVD